jgi:hypothetical protein
MRIEQPSINTCRVINDDGDYIDWNVAIFNHTRFKTVDAPFRDINRYWSCLSTQRKKLIFNCYKDIKEVLDRVSLFGEDRVNVKQLSNELPAKVASLYNLMPLEEIEQWSNKFSQVQFPTGLKIQHEEDDKLPDKTYLVSDYKGLVILTLTLRPMVPVWGEYVRLIQKQTGTLFKEYVGIKLINHTQIIHSEYYKRLDRYINACVTNDVETRGAVVAGISKSEIPDWLMSIVIIRRLSVGEIDASEETGNIITNIYGFVASTLDGLNKKFGGVREKYPEDKVGEDGETGSVIEGFRPKQQASAGDIMIFNVYADNTFKIVKDIDPTVPDDLIELCMESSKCLRTLNVTNLHQVLVQWVLAEVISPQAVLSLNREPFISSVAATQAILIHWGFYVLAGLLNSKGLLPDGNTAIINPTFRISSDLIDELNIYYPYSFNSSGKAVNPASNSIYNVVKNYIDCYIWECLLSDDLLHYIQNKPNNNLVIKGGARIFLLQGEIRIPDQLAMLVIKLNKTLEKQP